MTVPAQSFSAPARAAVIAAARFMPGDCGVFTSSSSACTTRTPRSRQADPARSRLMPARPLAESPYEEYAAVHVEASGGAAIAVRPLHDQRRRESQCRFARWLLRKAAAG